MFSIRLNELSFPTEECSARWIGQGTLVSRTNLNWDLPTLGIVSSHSEFNGFASSEWQTKLMAAIRFASQQGYRVLFARDTPYSLAIRTACTSLQVPAIELLVSNQQGTLSRATPEIEDVALRQNGSLVRVSLALERPSDRTDLLHLPIHDRAVVSLSRYLFALEIRSKGKMAELIDLRLRDTAFSPGSVILGIRYEKDLAKKSGNTIAKRWLDQGVIGWISHAGMEVEPSTSTLRMPCHSHGPSTTVPIFFASQWQPLEGKFLIHCTRARRGPWPDQSIEQFHDEIFETPWKSPPTAMDSLMRILEKQRLVATSALKPGSQATVSFSACSLAELMASRRFESHLSRWDWEPYGLMISSQWLASLSCQQVRYCLKAEMQSLSTEESTFAQVYSDTGNGRDWRVEREWRVADDVRLHQLPFSQGAVFVASIDEANRISHLSRWPICVVD
ncbi:MAG: hypothetical protein ACK56W_06705 [Pirellula sp.]|jgi:hypothetical protein|nr:hypothetical protein [Pirellula sp.]